MSETETADRCPSAPVDIIGTGKSGDGIATFGPVLKLATNGTIGQASG